MKPVTCAVLALVLGCVLTFAQTVQKTDKAVAVTIDDLPAGMADRLPASNITAMTAKLLGTLREQKVPVVGFVNEKKLYKPGEVDERIKALQMWLDSGFELGNHTFSHMSLNQNELKDWEDDVVQGESVLRILLAPKKMKLRYFRHPYLDTGRDLATRRKAEEFLSQRGYRIAPVTLDGWDWAFAGIYEDAKQRNDTELQQKIVKDYLGYHDAQFAYFEQLSQKVVGYEPKQVLLLHANAVIDSSRWRRRWAIPLTACPTLMQGKKAWGGLSTGRSRKGKFRRVLLCFRSGCWSARNNCTSRPGK